MGQCDSCHTVTLFGLQMLGLYPRYPTYCAQLCLYQSLPSPWWVNNTKNCTLLWRFGHFTWLTKNAKIAIFQFSTRFLKTFPSTDMVPLYLKKIVKPSSTRIYHKTAQLTHPRPSNSPRKAYPMWRDSRYIYTEHAYVCASLLYSPSQVRLEWDRNVDFSTSLNVVSPKQVATYTSIWHFSFRLT